MTVRTDDCRCTLLLYCPLDGRALRLQPRICWVELRVELRGFEPLTPSMRKKTSRPVSSRYIGHFVSLFGCRRPFLSAVVAVLPCCTPPPDRRVGSAADAPVDDRLASVSRIVINDRSAAAPDPSGAAVGANQVPGSRPDRSVGRTRVCTQRYPVVAATSLLAVICSRSTSAQGSLI
jgi:hypothetical protein